MNQNNLKKIKICVQGMHCSSCEILVERKFKKIVGVESVKVNQASGEAELTCSSIPKLSELNDSVLEDGYKVLAVKPKAQNNIYANLAEAIGIGLIVFSAYFALKQFNLLPDIGITNNMSYGFIFVIGLVAAVSSCIAVTGGLLLGVAARYNETHPNLTGIQKFKPQLIFNLGRIVSYTLLGGLVGSLGSVFTFSPFFTGLLSVAVSIVMLLMGLQLLNIFPTLGRLQPKLPKFLGHKIHSLSDGQSKTGPFILGAATFFLPCGFTQALQLYVLSRGSFMVGALTMLAFSLGTLPALLSLSALSSFAKGVFQKYFLKVAGVVVVMLGISNIGNGLALAGVNLNLGGNYSQNVDSVRIENGVQIVKMQVSQAGYSPSHFTIKKGIPVQWEIDGLNVGGCQSVIQMPKYNITKLLQPGNNNIVEFTATETGEVPFHCPMAMYTGSFTVTDGPDVDANQVSLSDQSSNSTPAIDCSKTKCQTIQTQISQAQGFYPNDFTVRKDVPVEFTLDDQVQLGGCMRVVILPAFNVAKQIDLGVNKIVFLPDKSGTYFFTCSMGSKLMRLTVQE